MMALAVSTLVFVCVACAAYSLACLFPASSPQAQSDGTEGTGGDFSIAKPEESLSIIRQTATNRFERGVGHWLRPWREFTEQVRASFESRGARQMALWVPLGCGVVGLALVIASDTPLVAVPPVFALALLPALLVRRRKRQRQEQFHRLFPGALDLMSRSLRAGHSLLESIRMVAEESSAPVSTEFREVVQAVQFGVSVSEALKALAARTESNAVNFFVTSLLIQRETGGNSAEIIDFISQLAKKRFEFEARVRAISAEGRFSAIVLFAMPFVLGGVLLFVNPTYLRPLVSDPTGKLMLAGGLFVAVAGMFVTRRLLDIRV